MVNPIEPAPTPEPQTVADTFSNIELMPETQETKAHCVWENLLTVCEYFNRTGKPPIEGHSYRQATAAWSGTDERRAAFLFDAAQVPEILKKIKFEFDAYHAPTGDVIALTVFAE